MSERARSAAAASLVALTAFLPFLGGAAAGAILYFRDLSLHFLPLRRLALEGLRHGELVLWNPYVHEGVPLSLPALGYPLDLLGVVAPSEAFLSLLLALHVPLGAVFFFLLARGLGLRLEGACGGALVYALGGFLLSTVNLYVYVQAAAWAPLVVLALVRLLTSGGPRALAAAALAVAVALSTTGVEIVAQAIAIGAALGLGARRPGRSLGRLAAALALGVALAAPVLVLVAGQVAGSARGRGFSTDVVLAHSVHPFTLLQALVGGLYGNLHNLANEWWGDNFFPRGFPYVLSLYLGAVVVSLAVVGLLSRLEHSRRLALVSGLGLALCLGRYAGLAPLVDAFPPAHAFRFPVKAYFTVHLTGSLLAGLGLSALAAGRRWRTLAGVATGFGGVLAAAPLVSRVASGSAAAFAAAFFPPRLPPATRTLLLDRVLADAAAGGWMALGVAALAVLVVRGTLGATRATWLVLALATTDLLRTGAGLNPMVASGFYQPSPELAARLGSLREGRVFSCSVETSPAYLVARHARGPDHELWSFAALLETLTPGFNVGPGVPTAFSPDLTMLVPTDSVLTPEEGSCRDLDTILPRLREAAVTLVLSLDALDHPDLLPAFSTSPSRIAPLTVHAYALRDPLPRLSLAGRGRIAQVRGDANTLEVTTDAEAATTLTVRDAWAPGWTARVDGEPRPVGRLGRHRSIEVPGGRSTVTMRYRPRGLGASAGASLLALLVVALLASRPANDAASPGPA